MVKGALDFILHQCVGYLKGGVDRAEFTDEIREHILQEALSVGQSGLRGLLFYEIWHIFVINTFICMYSVAF